MPVMGCILVLAYLSAHQAKATEMTSTAAAPPGTTTPADCGLDDNLHMRFGLPLWAFSMKGDVAIRDELHLADHGGRTGGHVDKDFFDFFDQLDFVAPLSVDLRKSRFYFHTEAIYVKTSADLNPANVLPVQGRMAASRRSY